MTNEHAALLPDWQRDLVADLRAHARDLRMEALRLEALADKIKRPPDGVRVECGGYNSVRFVGPVVRHA